MEYGLTQTQADTLKYIRKYIKDNKGVSPSIRNIAAHMDVNVGKTHAIIKALKERGHVRSLKGKSRSIYVIEDK